jgi:hypothetical protein
MTYRQELQLLLRSLTGGRALVDADSDDNKDNDDDAVDDDEVRGAVLLLRAIYDVGGMRVCAQCGRARCLCDAKVKDAFGVCLHSCVNAACVVQGRRVANIGGLCASLARQLRARAMHAR